MVSAMAKSQPSALARSFHWSLRTGLAAALRAAPIAAFFVLFLGGSHDTFVIKFLHPWRRVWLNPNLGGALLAAVSAGLVTFVINMGLLNCQQALKHRRAYGVLAGTMCATLPHIFFWLIYIPVFQPWSLYVPDHLDVGLMRGLLLSLIFTWPITIPASIFSTLWLLRQYHRAPGEMEADPPGMRPCPACGLMNVTGRRFCKVCHADLHSPVESELLDDSLSTK
jgi:hypothetical protein